MRAALVIAALMLAPTQASAQGYPGDNVIDGRIRASADAAESLQGPLDGAWTLVSGDGKPIYAFQIVDKPGGQSPLEGVWRDLRHPAIPGDIGLVDGLDRGGDSLTITLNATPQSPAVTVSLRRDANGLWSGGLHEGALITPVRLQRGG
jgi:hypothetical protein